MCCPGFLGNTRVVGPCGYVGPGDGAEGPNLWVRSGTEVGRSHHQQQQSWNVPNVPNAPASPRAGRESLLCTFLRHEDTTTGISREEGTIGSPSLRHLYLGYSTGWAGLVPDQLTRQTGRPREHYLGAYIHHLGTYLAIVPSVFNELQATLPHFCRARRSEYLMSRISGKSREDVKRSHHQISQDQHGNERTTCMY